MTAQELAALLRQQVRAALPEVTAAQIAHARGLPTLAARRKARARLMRLGIDPDVTPGNLTPPRKALGGDAA